MVTTLVLVAGPLENSHDADDGHRLQDQEDGLQNVGVHQSDGGQAHGEG